MGRAHVVAGFVHVVHRVAVVGRGGGLVALSLLVAPAEEEECEGDEGDASADFGAEVVW